MIVFLDFEASSLGKRSYPIEVGWVFEDGRGAARLIRPAPDWTDWDDEAQAIHGIDRDSLLADGIAHDDVAREMVATLTGHALYASAPSWDGKWLSALLRAAKLPRHSLRLGDSDALMKEMACDRLRPLLPPERLEAEVDALLAATEPPPSARPAHRALADAEAERRRWLAVREAVDARAARG